MIQMNSSWSRGDSYSVSALPLYKQVIGVINYAGGTRPDRVSVVNSARLQQTMSGVVKGKNLTPTSIQTNTNTTNQYPRQLIIQKSKVIPIGLSSLFHVAIISRNMTRKSLYLFLVASALSFASGRNSLPRSSQHSFAHSISSRRRNTDQPPWNPSASIDDKGFLTGFFRRKQGDWEEEVHLRTVFHTNNPCQIRQVPGDGNCLFHSLSLCLQYSLNGTHWDMSNRLDELYEQSRSLRAKAVACLRQNNRRLFLQGRESLRAIDLVTAAAQQYDLTPEEYCSTMEEDCVWGGGPEIVALSNILQRPIHVYELAVENLREEDATDEISTDSEKILTSQRRPTFVLRRMACFGSPRFDRKTPLHILSADSRFPDLQPGQQLSAGNHFLAVFPHVEVRRRKRIRGGADTVEHESIIEEGSERQLLPSRLFWWWQDLLQCLGV